MTRRILANVKRETFEPRLRPVGSRPPPANAPKQPHLCDPTLRVDIGDLACHDLFGEDAGKSLVMFTAAAKLIVQQVVVLAIEIAGDFQSCLTNLWIGIRHYHHHLGFFVAAPFWWRPQG